MAPNTRSSTCKRKAPEDSQANARSLSRVRSQPIPPRTEIRSVESHQESTRSASDMPREAEANVDLNTTSDTDLGIHRQETTPPQGPPLHARVRRPTDKTFRLRGIPKEWDKAEVQRRVKDRLSLGDNAAVVVRSLSQNPYRNEEQVATIEFPRYTLPGLGDNAKSEWRIMIEGHELLLDTHFFGITPLHAADDSSCDVDVIALSGLNGHAFGSFKSKSNEPTYMWLRDSLPTDIPHARIFIYGYDTQTINSDCFQNIGDIGQQLKSDLVLMRKTTGSSKRHLILIGHSLGGIIIKSAINKMSNGVENEQDIAKSICGVLFFGVPNQGMDIRSLIPMVGDRPNRELLQSLGMESEVLQNLSQSFQTSLDSQHSMVFSFYETRQSPTANKVDGKWTMSGPATVLVDRRSATNGRHWEQNDGYCYPVNRTHSEMVKLESRHDAVYAQTLHCLKGYQESPKTSSTALSKDQQDCLKSLSFPEQRLRLDQIHTATNTCNWLLQHQNYKAWIDHPSSLLWIEGNPGVGKSVLMKHALQDLEQRISHHGYLLLSFFVHGPGSSLQKSKLGLLRAILHQLLYQKPDLLSLVLPKYVEKCRTMNTWEWSEEELQIFLEKCLNSACRSTWVIILVDALDELGEDVALDVVAYFQGLIDLSSNIALNLRICFSCRHYPAISFNDGYRICVEKENSADIHYVIGSMLAEVTDSAITSLITNTANGVFQWAVLVSVEVRKLSRQHMMSAHIRQKVQDLPKGLYGLYLGLLSDASWTTLRLFQWLCFAQVTLDPFQLRQALAVSIEQSYSSLQQYEEALGFEDSEKGVTSMVKTLSRGLAEVIRQSSGLRVSLIHQSVKEFLIRGGFEYLERTLSINLVEGISNAYLSEACLKYLMTQRAPTRTKMIEKLSDIETLLTKFGANYITEPLFRNHSFDSHRSLPSFSDELSFLNRSFCQYAFIYGPFHAHIAEEQNNFPQYFLQLFKKPAQYQEHKSLVLFRVMERVQGLKERDLRKIDQYIQYTDDFHHSLAALAFLVHKSSRISLELIVNNDNPPNIRSNHACPSLHLALIDRRFETADLFLGIARLKLSAENEYGETLLIHAVKDEQLGLIDAIISCPEADPGHQDRSGRTPVSYAASRGSGRIVTVLLNSARANSNAPDSVGRTPLSYAAESGSSQAAMTLLAVPDIDYDSHEKGQNSLSYGAGGGPPKISEALIHRSQINLNSQDIYGRTYLSYASGSGLTKFVKTLLASAKVDPDIQDHEGCTPLLYASRNGFLEIVQALLGYSKTDPDPQDNYGRTPLSYASRNGSLEIVQALLGYPKVDPDSQDCHGRTPLSYATEEGHSEVASYLLRKHRCNPTKEDKSGRTPLSYITDGSTRRAFRYADKLEEVQNEQKKWRDKRNEEKKG